MSKAEDQLEELRLACARAAADISEALERSPAMPVSEWAMVRGTRALSWAWLIPRDTDPRVNDNAGFRVRAGEGVTVEAWARASRVSWTGTWPPDERRLRALLSSAGLPLDEAPPARPRMPGRHPGEPRDGRCPDGGTCHHECASACFRVLTCGPLSGVFEGDRWPSVVAAEHSMLAAQEERGLGRQE